MISLTWRRALVLAAAFMLIAGVLTLGRLARTGEEDRDSGLPHAAREFIEASQGDIGGAGDESAEARTAMEQFGEARTAPGIVSPGAYSAAFGAMTSLTAAGGAWEEATNKPYDADDPGFRDYYWSNSSGGSGLVTGRITALAADTVGHVYVGAADGGVWRSSTGGGSWSPIADSLPALSSGDLQLAPIDGALWFATGEANTSATSFTGTGVYRLANPTTGTFNPTDRVGGTELESTSINALRFDGHGRVWAATQRGVWYHADSVKSGPWTQAFAPNPNYLPGGSVAGTADGRNSAAYKNIVNDIAVDPRDFTHLIAAAAWRSGDTYNGFYESFDRGATWAKVNLTGGLDKSDIGNVTFAFSADGKTLYAINQSPKLLNSPAANSMTLLDGVYVSDHGALAGPWNKIASPEKLAASGSALSKQFGIGYKPGVQAWYNQFLLVDPNDAKHVFLGLEEVFETNDGGQHWSAVGPYWNFYFGCWAPDSVYPPNGEPNRCPQTTHPDQHAVAIGTYAGKQYLFVGNDGGIYRRPLQGQTNRNGNATDWESLNDGTIGALQYYAVGVGLANASNSGTPDGDGVLVSGGLQDNGGSLHRLGATKMVSPFGGDGGDILVDPNDGCRIVGEYVFLTMYVTETCGNTHGSFEPVATVFTIAPPDINARFIAPFVADANNVDRWLAGGNSLWFQDNGFAIRSGSEWQKVYTFADPGKVATAIAYTGDWAVAGWCGPCNNAGFTRGVVVGHYVGGAWSWTTANLGPNDSPTVPNRYVGGAAVDGAGNLYLAMNGFSRKFTEGPGAGKNHVFKSTDHGATWTSLDTPGGAAFPDVPSNSIKVLSSGALVVGTDLGVMYLGSGATSWQRLGTGLPVTVSLDVEVGPDGYIYAATHGRGIWRISASGL